MPYRYRVLVGLFFLSVITYLDRVCIAVAAKPMQDELHISASMWGWVPGAFTLSYAFFEIPSGMLGDRIGGRRVLTRIVLWWSAFTAITGAVTRYWMLLVVQFLFGAGEAGAFPNISASIARWFPERERGRAIGISWMASRIGGALSPLIVVPLMRNFGWRSAFYVVGTVGVLWSAAWYWWYRDHPQLMPKITAKELETIGETPGIARSHRIPWRLVTRNSNFLLILLMYHTYCWGSYFYISWMPNYLQRGRGFNDEQMKYWAMLPFIIGACGNLCGGSLSDFLVKRIGLKWGRRAVGGGGLLMGGILLISMAATADPQIAAVLLALSYGCQDSMLPVSWAVCMDVGQKYSGSISASMNMAGQVGSFISSVAFGYAVDYLRHHQFSVYQQFNLPIYPLAGMLLVSGILFLTIDPTRSVSKMEEAAQPRPLAPATV